MTDVDLDLILPPVIPITRSGVPIATIPGELPVMAMLQVVRLQAEGRANEQILFDTPDAPEFEEVRAQALDGIRVFYEQCAKLIQDHATMAVEGDLLELTASQIITLITLLGSPQERAQLIADALLRALDLGPEAEDDVPLEPASAATSSPSDDSKAGPRATGTRSRGRSSSPTARKRSKPKA